MEWGERPRESVTVMLPPVKCREEISQIHGQLGDFSAETGTMLLNVRPHCVPQGGRVRPVVLAAGRFLCVSTGADGAAPGNNIFSSFISAL